MKLISMTSSFTIYNKQCEASPFQWMSKDFEQSRWETEEMRRRKRRKMEEITKCQEEAENAAVPLSLPDDNGLTILRLSDNCQLPTKTRLNSSGGGMYLRTLRWLLPHNKRVPDSSLWRTKERRSRVQSSVSRASQCPHSRAHLCAVSMYK